MIFDFSKQNKFISPCFSQITYRHPETTSGILLYLKTLLSPPDLFGYEDLL